MLTHLMHVLIRRMEAMGLLAVNGSISNSSSSCKAALTLGGNEAQKTKRLLMFLLPVILLSVGINFPRFFEVIPFLVMFLRRSQKWSTFLLL